MLNKQLDSACGPTRGWHSICNRVPTPSKFRPGNRLERSAETFCGIAWLPALSVPDELLFCEVGLRQDCWRACRESLTDWIHKCCAGLATIEGCCWRNQMCAAQSAFLIARNTFI